MIIIQSKQEGFRRCEVAHSKTATEYEDDHWSDEELERLQDEPMLVVQHVDGMSSLSEEEELQAVIGGLDVMDATLWTDGGKPQVKAIEAVLGRQISAADRDEAWDIFQKSREGGE